MTRFRLWLVGGLGLLVVVTGTLALWPKRETLGECGEVLEVRNQQLSEPLTRGDPTIAALGDSYTQGLGLSGPEVAWPAALGERLGAEVVVDGVGSTGFTTAGLCYLAEVSYGERLESDPPDADIVVVQGGVNDALLGRPEAVAEAAAGVLGRLRDARTVVVVGPPPVPAAEPSDIATVDAALRQACDDAGRVYVPLLDAGVELLDDRVHPTVSGQQRIAELVAAAIATVERAR
jgi:lysophospholipase L1-like esterase